MSLDPKSSVAADCPSLAAALRLLRGGDLWRPPHLLVIREPPAAGKGWIIQNLLPFPRGTELWDEEHNHGKDLKSFHATCVAWLVIATMKHNQTPPPEALVFDLSSWADDDQARVRDQIYLWIERRRPQWRSSSIPSMLSRYLFSSVESSADTEVDYGDLLRRTLYRDEVAYKP